MNKARHTEIFRGMFSHYKIETTWDHKKFQRTPRLTQLTRCPVDLSWSKIKRNGGSLTSLFRGLIESIKKTATCAVFSYLAESEGCARVRPVPDPSGACGGTNRSRRLVEQRGLSPSLYRSFIWPIKKPATCAGFSYLAESEGFEPPVGLTPRLISSQVH